MKVNGSLKKGFFFLFPPYFFQKISAKFALYILTLLLITLSGSYLITIEIMKKQIVTSIIRRAEALSRSIASVAGHHLIPRDILALDNMVYRIKTANPDITSIAIVDNEGEIIVHSELGKIGEKILESPSTPEESGDKNNLLRHNNNGLQNRNLVIENPVEFMGEKLGRVLLEVDWSSLRAAQAEAKRKILLLYSLITAFALAGSIILSHRLTRPVRELARGVELMKRQGKTQSLKIYSMDELGHLTASFNEMAAQLSDQKEKLAAYAQEIEQAYVATVKILAAAIEARDPYTLGHSTRVAQLAMALAKEAGLSPEEIETIEIACLFHDVGKIRIPDVILHKKGQLEPEEIQEMRKHPEYGAEILSKAPCLYKYIPAVRHHHEWYNGHGYPDRLRGEEIPLAAAIIALADSFDAITSDRPYRQALSQEEALEVIAKNAGKQFHPELASLFIKMIKKNQKEARWGEKFES